MIIEQIKEIISNTIQIKNNEYYSCIIGKNPSTTARSPKLWNAAFKKHSIKIKMFALDIKQKNISKVFNLLRSDKNFIGGSVTVPYKETIFKLLKNNLTKETKKIGAVNSLFRDYNLNLIGTNTDGEASLKSFTKKFGYSKNKKIAILGLGGAGKAVNAFFSSNFLDVKIISRNKNDKNYCKLFNAKWHHWKNLNNEIVDRDVIVNCTSIGFDKKINESPIQEEMISKLKRNAIIFDIIYNPNQTKLLSLAKKYNCQTMNGADMNLEQAVIAFNYTNNIKKNRSVSITKNAMIKSTH